MTDIPSSDSTRGLDTCEKVQADAQKKNGTALNSVMESHVHSPRPFTDKFDYSTFIPPTRILLGICPIWRYHRPPDLQTTAFTRLPTDLIHTHIAGDRCHRNVRIG